MKVPEPLFVIINPIVALILRSPLHRLLSGSVMLVKFTGRRSGRRFTTPVRYLAEDDVVRAYSNTDTQWWRNLRGGATARLLIGGEEHTYRTEVIEDDPPRIRAALERYLSVFPEDAVYHDVGLDESRRPKPEDLDRAAREAVVVEARRTD